MIENNSRSSYFAAINSGVGFVSRFEELFFGENIKHRYVIKGGPGTGKSSFMRRVGESAARRGLPVEYYYCSSDTDSLDGAVIGGSIAIFDGTAPHSYDTVLPGVRDEIVNLGQFWNAKKLSENEAQIRECARLKAAAYKRAYGYLSAALATSRAADGAVRECVLEEKLEAAARRDVARLGLTQNGTVRTAQTEAMGVRGRVYLPTLARSATRIHVVDDCYGVGTVYLSALLSLAVAGGFDVKVSYDTVDVSKVREIFFTETGDCFTSAYTDGEGACSHVNVKRFIDVGKYASVRQIYRVAMGCYDRLCRLAEESLASAGKAHAEMEKYYVAAMDFSALEKYCVSFIDKIAVL